MTHFNKAAPAAEAADTVSGAFADLVATPAPVSQELPAAQPEDPESEHAADAGGEELFYRIGERLFGAVAPDMVKNGWSLFPQEIYGDRKPGKVFGETIAIKRQHDLENHLPSAETLETWARHCAHLNVACVFGPASGHTFAVDIDVTDRGICQEIADIADEILGFTPLRRQGRAPKLALIYRHSAEDAVRSTSRRIADTEHQVEILGAGKILTFHGRHHKTGRYFKWLHGDGNPLFVGPQAAPLVSSARVQEFLDAVDARHTFATALGGGKSGGQVEWGNSEGIRVPKVATGADVERDASGKISGGREAYLNKLVWDVVVRGNGAAFHAAREAGESAIAELKAKLGAAILEAFAETAVCTGRWRLANLHSEVSTRVNRLIAKALSGFVDIRLPSTEAQASAQTKSRREALPRIRVEAGEIERVIDEAEAALLASGRGLYQRGGGIVALGRVDVRTTEGLVSVPVIRALNEDALYEEMSSAAVFETWNASKEGFAPANPPMQVIKSYMARQGRWKLPVLDAVITAPTLRADGSILSKPGYDATTGLYFDPMGVEFPEIPENPTRADAEFALGGLWGVIETFPFVNEVDRAVALSMQLTAPVRRNFPLAPAFAVSATTAGSGKTKLAQIAGVIATGNGTALVGQGRTDEENMKLLGGALLKGAPVICMDNCDMEFGGAFMEMILTTEQADIRIMRTSDVRTVSTNALIAATGNNLVIAKDMTRRTMLCRLDPGVDRPEEREFEFEPVEQAKKARPRLVWAALTILRAFHVAGRPRQATPLGSFEVWSGWVRDALMWLGEADACKSIEAARETDPKLESLSAIQSQWLLALGDERVSARRIIEMASKKRAVSNWESEFVHPDFREALLAVAGDGGAINGRRLGKWLGAHAGRIVSGYRIEKAGVSDGIAVWKLAPVAS